MGKVCVRFAAPSGADMRVSIIGNIPDKVMHNLEHAELNQFVRGGSYTNQQIIGQVIAMIPTLGKNDALWVCMAPATWVSIPFRWEWRTIDLELEPPTHLEEHLAELWLMAQTYMYTSDFLVERYKDQIKLLNTLLRKHKIHYRIFDSEGNVHDRTYHHRA